MIRLPNNERINEELFKKFCEDEHLSDYQREQFHSYATLLLDNNEHINLTSITDSADVIHYHFQDSIKIRNYIDFTTVRSICDVGTGGGFPGIPLKILFPHLNVVLIEVTNKKIDFLMKVIHNLKLENIEICSLDWRTFLRKTAYSIDLFVARASLHPAELIRIFKPTCFYNSSRLVYWASSQWIMGQDEGVYFWKEFNYSVGVKNRRFIFFTKKPL